MSHYDFSSYKEQEKLRFIFSSLIFNLLERLSIFCSKLFNKKPLILSDKEGSIYTGSFA